MYETSDEFLTSGDFNGDGRIDALVLDKATGNARVGYQNSTGALDWAPAIPTGADLANAVAVGRFAETNRDSIAVTSESLNRIHVLNLSNPTNVPNATILYPPHPNISMLVGIDAPYGTAAERSWLDVGSHDPGITLLDLLAFAVDGSSTIFNDQIATEGFLESASAFRRSATDLTLLAAIQRGSNDTFVAYAYTNTAAPVLVRSNLPAGSEYVSGRFHNEPYPRLLFYVPGESNVIVQPLTLNGSNFEFGAATVNSFTSAVEHVFFVDEQTNGSVVIRFGDGVVSGLRPESGNGQLHVSYGIGLGASGNVIGVIPLGLGKFAALSRSSNSIYSVSAQVFALSGTNYTLTSSNALPSVTTSGTRGNVWLFQAEPFLNSAATLIGSLNAPAWSSAVLGFPGSLSVRVEADAGTASGLGQPSTNNFGAPPTGTAYVLPNQYRADISFFGYAPPQAPEPSIVTISPPPGSYDGPIQISFTHPNPSDEVYYRRDSNEVWQFYSGPFSLTNDATVQYYGNALTGERSRTQYASYLLGNPDFTPEEPSPLPGNTNPPPVLNTNFLHISANGTVFYSRHTANNQTIWAINLDGSGETFITTGHRPRVTKDGRLMAFLREGDPLNSQGNIWLRDLQTGTETRFFINTNSSIVGFDWRGNKNELVFDYSCNLWDRTLDGTLTSLPFPAGCAAISPVINPINERIAYANLNLNGPPGLYVTPPNWSSPTRLNLPNAGWRWPAWSADGTQLLIADADLFGPENHGTNLWIVNANGSNLRQITALSSGNGFPRGAIWKPDASCLVGAGKIYGTNGLWIIPLAADGTSCHCPPLLLPTLLGSGEIDFAGSIVVAPPVQVVTNSGLFIRLDPAVVTVYWSTDFDSFTLESTTDLANPVWVPINGPYFLNGNYYEYYEARAALQATKYFRLRYPGVIVLTPPQPKLSLRFSANQSVLAWPQAYVGYTLEVATNLSAPILWKPLPGPYSI
ncbi:MAG TPA: hypothetical protein VIV82_03705, partial [Verrucomicrobiae bacterium]